jgi:hypothetical protein
MPVMMNLPLSNCDERNDEDVEYLLAALMISFLMMFGLELFPHDFSFDKSFDAAPLFFMAKFLNGSGLTATTELDSGECCEISPPAAAYYYQSAEDCPFATLAFIICDGNI